MQSVFTEEREQKEGRLLAVIQALKEVEFVVESCRSKTTLTDAELLEAQKRITDPIFMYARLLENL